MSPEDELFIPRQTSGGNSGWQQQPPPWLPSADEDLPLLTIGETDMRLLGTRVMDMVVGHLTELPGRPAVVRRSREQMEQLLSRPIPWEPTDLGDVLDDVVENVLSANALPSHPRYMGFVPGPSNFASIVGRLLATAYNLWPATWMTAPAATMLELETIGWLAELCGLPPEEAGGTFVSGGSIANLTGLAVARHTQLGEMGTVASMAVAYVTSQTHSSVTKALRLLGFTHRQIRTVPTDGALAMDADILRKMIERDRGMGLRPFCVVGTAGTTNSGAVDPLPQLAEICAANGLWFHVDAAIGAAAKIGTLERDLVAGLELADSVVVDPHKGFAQPFEMGGIIVRDRRLLETTFAARPEYLQDTDGEINLCDWGIQLARDSKALPFWMSLRTFGLAAFSQAVDHNVLLARHAEQYLRQSDCWTVVTPAQLGIITFRYTDGPVELLDAIQRDIVVQMLESGYAMVLSTSIAGQTVLRLAINNPRATRYDVTSTIDQLEAAGRDAAKRVGYR